jgi:hypothetical protein
MRGWGLRPPSPLLFTFTFTALTEPFTVNHSPQDTINEVNKMENKQDDRIWRTTQKLYGVLLLAYINLLDEMTEPVWSKYTKKCFDGARGSLSAAVYDIINDTQIDIDWEYLGVDKAWLRKMEMDLLTPKNYHLRIGSYPTN